MFLDDGMTKSPIMEELGISPSPRSSAGSRIPAPAAPPRSSRSPGGAGRRPKPAYATREEELEARVRELELENEILKRISALADGSSGGGGVAEARVALGAGA